MTQEEVDLLFDLLGTCGEEWVCTNLKPRLFNLLYFLYDEVNRLKTGRFTDEEFQNLCHDKTVQDGFESFKQGCRDFQKQLFNGRCDGEIFVLCVCGVRHPLTEACSA